MLQRIIVAQLVVVTTLCKRMFVVAHDTNMVLEAGRVFTLFAVIVDTNRRLAGTFAERVVALITVETPMISVASLLVFAAASDIEIVAWLLLQIISRNIVLVSFVLFVRL